MKRIVFKESGKDYEINPEGSLGLLALGAIGLKAWREARQKAFANEQIDKSLNDQTHIAKE